MTHFYAINAEMREKSITRRNIRVRKCFFRHTSCERRRMQPAEEHNKKLRFRKLNHDKLSTFNITSTSLDHHQMALSVSLYRLKMQSKYHGDTLKSCFSMGKVSISSIFNILPNSMISNHLSPCPRRVATILREMQALLQLFPMDASFVSSLIN